MQNTFMQDIFVFGGGAWGLALAHAFSQKNRVFVLSRRSLPLPQYNPLHATQNHAHDTAQAQKSPVQLSYSDFSSLYQSAHNPLCVIAIASAFLRTFMEQAQFLKPIQQDMRILVASKGIEQNSGAFVNEILESYFQADNLCYLAGPSFAKEVMAGLPCALVLHAHNEDLSRQYATCFPDFIKTYIQNDIIGAEIAGAYKNVIAIAGGICDGLQLGNNAKASLLSRGLVEMARFGVFFGAKQETFLGLSGSGDLFLTSNSTMSRNYRVGFGLAQNKTLAAVLEDIGEVAEGVYSAKSITQISKKHNLYTPIAFEVQAILEGGAVKDGLKNLLTSKNKI